MLCAELERLEAEFDDVITGLEEEGLPEQRRKDLERKYARISHAIKEHQAGGHAGGPCFEENGRY
jgi:hypothetical protein